MMELFIHYTSLPEGKALEDEVEELNEELENYLKDDIEGAAIVEVEMTMTIEYEGEEIENDQEQEFTVFKYDGKWYICPDDLDLF